MLKKSAVFLLFGYNSSEDTFVFTKSSTEMSQSLTPTIGFS